MAVRAERAVRAVRAEWDNGSGSWVEIRVPDHFCVFPDVLNMNPKPGSGSIWQCECGRRFVWGHSCFISESPNVLDK